MSKIKKIGFFAMLIAFTACSQVNIPPAYNYKISEIQKNPFGCWTTIEYRTSGNDFARIDNVAGELITIDENILYLLTEDGKVKQLSKISVQSAHLYTHKNQRNTYWGLTGILVAPNIIGALVVPDAAIAFLIMAIPTLLIGPIHANIEENAKGKSVLSYPGLSNLEDFKKFSRFPAGLPENIDLQQLYLKKPDESLPVNR